MNNNFTLIQISQTSSGLFQLIYKKKSDPNRIGYILHATNQEESRIESAKRLKIPLTDIPQITVAAKTAA